MATFVDDVLAGRTSLEAVDDYVDRWHDGGAEGTLAEFLGLSLAEYDAWVRDAGVMDGIVEGRGGSFERRTRTG